MYRVKVLTFALLLQAFAPCGSWRHTTNNLKDTAGMADQTGMAKVDVDDVGATKVDEDMTLLDTKISQVEDLLRSLKDSKEANRQKGTDAEANLAMFHAFNSLETKRQRAGMAGIVSPNIHRPMKELYQAADFSNFQKITKTGKDHDKIYAALLESMIKRRGGTPGSFEENRQTQIAYVKSLYQSKFCRKPEANPQVFFVLGGTAVGKSTFVRNVVTLPDNTVHVNADDIRSLIMGNYAVYSRMTGSIDGQFIPELMRFTAQDNGAKDANAVRFWVQAQVQERGCHFMADSYSVPDFAVNGFIKEGYNAHVYYLEIGLRGTKYDANPVGDFAKKVEISKERIRARVAKGEHASSSTTLMDDGFLEGLRAQIVELAKKLTIPIEFYITQKGKAWKVDNPSLASDQALLAPTDRD